MHTNWHEQINEWKEELLRFSASDLLWHIPDNHQRVLCLSELTDCEILLPTDTVAKAIIKEQQHFYKQSGVNSLCITESCLFWNDGGAVRRSPWRLKEAFVEERKWEKNVSIQHSDDSFINPVLEKHFRFLGLNIEELDEGVLPAGWELQAAYFVGNFHYHRYALLRDVEGYLNDSKAEKSLIGHFFTGSQEINALPTPIAPFRVTPVDSFQKKVLERLASGENLTVIGPPGSGKSQLITNVLLQHAYEGRKVLCCSEKLSALNVLMKKMEELNLHLFCEPIFNDTKEKGAFISSLKRTWLFLEEQAQSLHSKDDFIFELEEQRIELKFQRLGAIPQLPHSAVASEQYSEAPDVEHWFLNREELQSLHAHFREVTNRSFNEAAFFSLKPELIRNAELVGKLRKEVEHIVNELHILHKAFPDLVGNDSPETWGKLNRLAIHAQLMSHDLFVQSTKLLESSPKAQTRFTKLADEYAATLNQLEAIAFSDKRKWKREWSEAELAAAMKTFQNAKWWTRSYRKWKSKFQADYDPNVFSRELALDALTVQKSYIIINRKRIEIQAKLAEWGVRHAEVEIPVLQNLITRRNAVEPEIWSQTNALSIHQRQGLINEMARIARIQRFLVVYTRSERIAGLTHWLEELTKEWQFLESTASKWSEIIAADRLLWRFLPSIVDWDNVDENLRWHNLRMYRERNPDLFVYSGREMQQDLVGLQDQETLFLANNARQFIKNQLVRFEYFHQLLATPAAKLDAREKKLKETLRKGRSVLVKEFNKQRQHLTIRELLESPAAEWINLLKPILLMSPLSVSRILPNTMHLVDLLVMDEASQLPLVHAIPSMYRARQVCVVGDPMQMAPSAYFVQGSREREDVLSRSLFHFPRITLKHHYRSQHAELIRFSNRYFYQNELLVFPHATLTAERGLHGYFCEEGQYIDRVNNVEAERVVKVLKALLVNCASKETIGIVAFSETQLKCIASKIDLVEEENRVSLMTLEQVQGDEFDHVIISVGYGPDENGVTHLRFGPINQFGGDKRLNVLMSRSRKSMHVVYSLRTELLVPNENLGVDLLGKCLRQIERQEFKGSIDFLESWGFVCEINLPSQEIIICDPHLLEEGFHKLRTLFWLADARQWNVQIRLTKDRFIN